MIFLHQNRREKRAKF